MKKPPKLSGHSYNSQEDLVSLLLEKCPEVFTEGKIDPTKLKATLGDAIEADGERYGLSWAGKSDCFRHIQEPTTATLVPDHKASVDFEETKNIFIEGDNLQALKVLQKSYYGKVKMMYIDPPYNTGGDSFIYPDRFQESKEEYMERIGQKEEGRLTRDGMWQTNNKDNGHYHSNWLSMMYPRLFLARNLLRQDGVIFVSIDDHEVHNLRAMLNEIFGEDNFISTISRVMKTGGAKGNFFTPNVEFILVYARNIFATEFFRSGFSKEQIDRYYNKTETIGLRKGEIYGEERIYKASLDPRPNQRYWIECPDGSFAIPPGNNFPKQVVHGEKIIPKSDDGVWKWTLDRYQEEFKKGNIVFKKTTTSALVDANGKQSNWNIYNKVWLKDQEEKGVVPSNFIDDFENRQSAAELKELEIPFDFAKPTSLLKYLLEIARTKSDDLILDFFAGSGTTAHAVMALNAEDGGTRQCISVQLGEPCDEESEAKKAGFNTIADIARERVRRAGKKIKEDTGVSIDYGFKAFTLDESNFKIWRSDVGNAEGLAKQMEMFIDNVKNDSTQENILYELMLKTGLDLNTPTEKVATKAGTYFKLSDGKLVVCIEQGMTEELADKVLAEKPEKFICLDKAFGGNDQLKTNVLLQMEQAGVDFLVI